MTDDATAPPLPTFEDVQHWTLLMARAQQMIMEAWADNLGKAGAMPGFGLATPANGDPMQWMSAGAEAWSKGLEAWSQMIGQATRALGRPGRPTRRASADRSAPHPAERVMPP